MGLQYKKASPAFNDTARARLWGISVGDDSYVSTPSSDDMDDELAALVDSFYDESDFEQLMEDSEAGSNNLHETKGGDLIEMLDELMEEMGDELELGQIRAEVERVMPAIGSGSDHEDRFFKERVVDRLCQRGYDAGLCKSSGEQSDGPPTGSHEYIDVIIRGKTRYIVEPNLPSNFEIARPSNEYTKVFQGLPEVFVGRPEHLKCIVRIMSTAAVDSMKSAGMHVPPWRRREYVLAKWFSSYKRSASFGSVKIEKRGQNVRKCRMAIGSRDSTTSRTDFQSNIGQDCLAMGWSLYFEK